MRCTGAQVHVCRYCDCFTPRDPRSHVHRSQRGGIRYRPCCCSRQGGRVDWNTRGDNRFGRLGHANSSSVAGRPGLDRDLCIAGRRRFHSCCSSGGEGPWSDNNARPLCGRGGRGQGKPGLGRGPLVGGRGLRSCCSPMEGGPWSDNNARPLCGKRGRGQGRGRDRGGARPECIHVRYGQVDLVERVAATCLGLTLRPLLSITPHARARCTCKGGNAECANQP